jgi:hypothetical protein
MTPGVPQGRQEPGYRQYTVYTGRKVKECASPPSFFVNFPHRAGMIRRGRAGSYSNRGDRTECRDRGVRAWAGSDGSPGPPPSEKRLLLLHVLREGDKPAASEADMVAIVL